LGSAVSELAIRQAVDLRKHTDLRVAINLSAAEVAQPDTTLRIEEQAKAAGLPLSAIEIELTEEILLERISDRTLGQLADLRARGVRLALDDFGTGTSGLSQLMRLPFDVIKLDQRFIQQLPSHASAKAITIATVSLAHSLGMEVVAEGVETKEQLEAVNDLGCDAAQGFLLARPMSSDDLADWLEHQPFLPPSRITSIPIRLKRGGSPAIN
jgi:EAL domain-containing protein (putative c-di-GMP-specific phosphodiesterase class I)